MSIGIIVSRNADQRKPSTASHMTMNLLRKHAICKLWTGRMLLSHHGRPLNTTKLHVNVSTPLLILFAQLSVPKYPSFNESKNVNFSAFECKGGVWSSAAVNLGISGNNIDSVYVTSAEQCKQRCADEVRFKCRSVDYYVPTGLCYLQMVTR